VFPAERGDGHYQGMKGVWSKAIEKAELPGVTPHTLRHTMGSTAISTGEARLPADRFSFDEIPCGLSRQQADQLDEPRVRLRGDR